MDQEKNFKVLPFFFVGLGIVLTVIMTIRERYRQKKGVSGTSAESPRLDS